MMEIKGIEQALRDGYHLHAAWMYHISKKATGKDFWTAMEAAFKAPEIEVSDDEETK